MIRAGRAGEKAPRQNKTTPEPVSASTNKQHTDAKPQNLNRPPALSIDSLALELDSSQLEALKSVGVVVEHKSIGEFNADEVKALAKKERPNPKAYDYLGTYHTKRGITCLITKHKRAKSFKLTFKGLAQYSQTSELMRADLIEVLGLIDKAGRGVKLARLDIALDTPRLASKDNAQIAKNTKREAFKFKNTTYFKTPAEKARHKRTNERLDIKTYAKPYAGITRLEFCFKGSFFSSKSTALKRVQKTIIKASKNTSFSKVDLSALSFDIFAPNKLIDYFSAYTQPKCRPVRTCEQFLSLAKTSPKSKLLKPVFKAKSAKKIKPSKKGFKKLSIKGSFSRLCRTSLRLVKCKSPPNVAKSIPSISQTALF